MKKLTFLMLHLNYGGLEKQTITLINELAKLGKYDIEIISVYDILKGKSFYDIDRSVKIKFLSKIAPDHKGFYEAKKKFNIFKLIKESFIALRCLYYKSIKLNSEIKKLKTDVIFSTRIEFAKLIKRKDTINITQEHSYITTDKYIKKIKNSFLYINYVVVMTDAAKKFYENNLLGVNSFSKVVKIENIVLSDEKNISTLNNDTLISIGRLEEEKDFETLIKVFRVVNSKLPNIKLKIIGDGRKKEELIHITDKFGLLDKIDFLGSISSQKVNEELVKSDLFITTSKKESFSLVIVEAFGCGVPAISFNIEVGPKEIIENGVNGFLVENRKIYDMADKIVEIMCDKNLLNILSKSAISTSKKYLPVQIIPKWERIIGE